MCDISVFFMYQPPCIYYLSQSDVNPVSSTTVIIPNLRMENSLG